MFLAGFIQGKLKVSRTEAWLRVVRLFILPPIVIALGWTVSTRYPSETLIDQTAIMASDIQVLTISPAMEVEQYQFVRLASDAETNVFLGIDFVRYFVMYKGIMYAYTQPTPDRFPTYYRVDRQKIQDNVLIREFRPDGEAILFFRIIPVLVVLLFLWLAWGATYDRYDPYRGGIIRNGIRASIFWR